MPVVRGLLLGSSLLCQDLGIKLTLFSRFLCDFEDLRPLHSGFYIEPFGIQITQKPPKQSCLTKYNKITIKSNLATYLSHEISLQVFNKLTLSPRATYVRRQTCPCHDHRTKTYSTHQVDKGMNMLPRSLSSRCITSTAHVQHGQRSIASL